MTRFSSSAKGALLLALSAASACGAQEGGTARNVLLISIDTLRPDHLSCYGHERETSPAIDALAKDGVLFRDVSSVCPWTLPAHVSMMTGRYPSRHGVKDENQSLSADVPTLATQLAAAGYDTKAVVSSHFVSKRYGLGQGFASYDELAEFSDLRSEDRRNVNRGEDVTTRAIEWFNARGNRPFFLFLHYYDVHTDFTPKAAFREQFTAPYAGQIDGTTRQLVQLRDAGVKLPPDDLRHLRDLYDAEIRQVDDHIARLMGLLDQLGLAGDTIVVVTSDHGEEFMEHGSLLHGRTHYQEVIAIPLILRGPGLPKGRVVDQAVSLVDLAPTVLALVGLEAFEGADGSDLSVLWNDGALDGRALYSEADHDNEVQDMKRMVRIDQYKLFYDRVARTAELYDLAEDAAETHDLAAEDPERVRWLLARLEAFMAFEASGEPLPELSAEQLEDLRQLGYGGD